MDQLSDTVQSVSQSVSQSDTMTNFTQQHSACL